jgi:hypothetical protein
LRADVALLRALVSVCWIRVGMPDETVSEAIGLAHPYRYR